MGLVVFLDQPIYLLLISIAGFPSLLYFDRVMEMHGTPVAKKS